MPRVDGVEAIRRLRERAPATRVIVLTSFADEDKVLPAVRAGAAGYLLKDVQPAGARRARSGRSHAGEALLHPAVAARVAAPRTARGDGAARRRATSAHRRASSRCSRCSPAAARTRRSRSSSASSEKTVKTHVGNILGKLGLSDRTQAALYAVERGSSAGRTSPHSRWSRRRGS